MTTKSNWEEEFENARPEQGWMPKQITHSEQSEIKPFGYKYYENGSVHEVTDWGHIKNYIRKLLLSQKDTLIREVEKIKPVFYKSDTDVGYNEAIQDVLNLIKKL